MSETLVIVFVLSIVLTITYLFGMNAGWEDGRTVYRMWDSRRFTDILTKHLDIQTDDGCDADYVRQAIKAAEAEYQKSKP